MARKLVVEIIGDASSLDRAYNKAGASSKRFGASLSGLTKVAAAAGVALSAEAVVEFGLDAVKSAIVEAGYPVTSAR